MPPRSRHRAGHSAPQEQRDRCQPCPLFYCVWRGRVNDRRFLRFHRRRTEPPDGRVRKATEPTLQPLICERLLEGVELYVRGWDEEQGQKQTQRLAADDR